MDNKYTNIPGEHGDDWNLIPEIKTEGGYREKLPGGGTFSVVTPGESSQTGNADQMWDERESFKEQVFKQIGGNPLDMTADKALGEFKNNGGYEGLFNHVFHGIMTWQDRGRMSPEQKTFWNQAVARERAAVVKRTNDQKNHAKEQYNYMMGEFDKLANLKAKERQARAKQEQAKVKAQAENKKQRSKPAFKITDHNSYMKAMEGFDPAKGQFMGQNEDGDVVPRPVDNIELDNINMKRRKVKKGLLVPVTKKSSVKQWKGILPDREVIETSYHEMPYFSEQNIPDMVREFGYIKATDNEEERKKLEQLFAAQINQLPTEVQQKFIAQLRPVQQGQTQPEAQQKPQAPPAQEPQMAVSHDSGAKAKGKTPPPTSEAERRRQAFAKRKAQRKNRVDKLKEN